MRERVYEWIIYEWMRELVNEQASDSALVSEWMSAYEVVMEWESKTFE